jgi:hypothetical protein
LQDSLMARLDRLAPVKEIAQIRAAIDRLRVALSSWHGGSCISSALRLSRNGRGAGTTTYKTFQNSKIMIA